MPPYRADKKYDVDLVFVLSDDRIALHIFGEEWEHRVGWLDFRLVEVEAEDADGFLLYPTDENRRPSMDGGTRDPKAAIAFADGYLKWDGCMQLDLGQHFCGRRMWKAVPAAMNLLYDYARLELGFEGCE